ncbi:MAG: lipase family protein [Chitinophagaceae bacterium]|nr:lipase family protein [Chitinophagaceae bacterium]
MKYLCFSLASLLFLLSCNHQDSSNVNPGNENEQPPVNTETAEPPKPPFTDTTAALFAEITYCPAPQGQLDKHAPGWKVVWDPAGINGNYAFVATDGEKYVLAIRGSLLSFTEDAFNNWVYHDLNVAVQDKWPYCANEKAKISQGSYIAWQNMEKLKDKTSGKTLWTFLSENVKGENPLYIAGHSLGGNIAIVYASYLWSKFNEGGQPKSNIHVTTFAAPAPGNRHFAEDFDKKFPDALRIENSNDIVAKFPCTDRMKKLGDLFTNGPAAGSVEIGYKNINTSLSNAFTIISTGLNLLEFSGGFSGYSHTSGNGRILNIPLSGKNNGNTAGDWFAEAGYQHSMERYAAAIGAPVINCDPH